MLFLVEANSFLEVADCNLYDTCNFFCPADITGD